MARVTPAGARKLNNHGVPATRLLIQSGRKTPSNIRGPSKRIAAQETPLAGQIGDTDWASDLKICDEAQAVR